MDTCWSMENKQNENKFIDRRSRSGSFHVTTTISIYLSGSLSISKALWPWDVGIVKQHCLEVSFI